MTKELIERINKELTDFAHNRELGHLLCESVIAIERLELEAIAATLRIENDKLVISTLQRKFAVLSDFGDMETMYNAGIEQEHEIVTMRERIRSLKRCIGDFEGTTRENIELRAELSALKNQPHIARATGKNSGDYSEVARVYETPLPAGVALYLAPGAQPVPEAYTAAMAACVEFVRKCEVGEAKSYASYTQMKKAIAMLEAAKQ